PARPPGRGGGHLDLAPGLSLHHPGRSDRHQISGRSRSTDRSMLAMDQPQGFRHGEMQRDEKATAAWTLLSYQVTDLDQVMIVPGRRHGGRARYRGEHPDHRAGHWLGCELTPA